MAAAPGGRRGPGRSAGIDTRQIVEAARGLEPDELTMQAVAGRLGVDRTAVNYHVKDRDSLLQLVARDAFASRFAEFAYPVDADWREGCAAYARALRDALVATGALVEYIRYDAPGGLDLLRPAEMMIESMVRAGFTTSQVARAALMLANIAMSSARDQVFASDEHGHPQPQILAEVLRRQPAGDFPAMRHIMEEGQADYADDQLDFCLRVFILGLERMLPAEQDRGSR